MAFKTFVDSVALPAADLNTYLMKQAVIVCTSGTRPASPAQGECIYQTDTDSFKYWSGSVWDVFPGSLVSTSTGANTVSASAGAEVVGAGSGLTLASVSVSSTRAYQIVVSGRASQPSSLVAVIVRVRASTGTVTTASTTIASAQIVPAATAGAGAFDVTFANAWIPASTASWNIAVTCAGASSSNASWGPGNSNPVITLYGA